MQSKNRGIWIGIGIVLALTAIGAGVVWFAARKKVVPPDPAADRDKAAAFIASSDFSKMTLTQQRNYVEKMRPPRGQRPPRQNTAQGQRPRRPDENLTEEQRKVFRKNMRRVMEAEMSERLDKFFAMSREDQLAELDRSIEEHKKRRMNRPPRPPEQPQTAAGNNAAAPAAAKSDSAAASGTQTANGNAQQNRRRRPSAQDRREHDEEFSPATRAKMSAYFQMMRLREQGKLK